MLLGNTIKVYSEHEGFTISKAHLNDAGFDLKTPRDFVLRAGSSEVIDTGIHIDIPESWYGKLEGRSGLNVKHDIVCLGGVIDSGYTGSIVVKLYNLGSEDYKFKAGDRIVQLIIQPCPFSGIGIENVDSCDEFNDSDRKNNGFGSSGR